MTIKETTGLVLVGVTDCSTTTHIEHQALGIQCRERVHCTNAQNGKQKIIIHREILCMRVYHLSGRNYLLACGQPVNQTTLNYRISLTASYWVSIRSMSPRQHRQ